jgi:hypothetical protein
MSAPLTLTVEQWRRHNDAYLGIALQWLRLKLAALATPSEAADDQLHDAHRRMLQAEQATLPPALVLLAAALGLSRFEQEVVLLCSSMELDTRIGPLCADAHDDQHKAFPTFALAMAMLDEPEWTAVSPAGPLRSWRLVEPDPRSSEPLILQPLRADERVVHFVKGLNVLDERLAALTRPLEPPPAEPPPSQQAVIETISTAIQAPGRLVQVVGANRASQRSVAQAVAVQLGVQLLEFPAASLPGAAADLHELARLWRREARLMPVALLVTADDELSPTQVLGVRRLAEGAEGPIFLSVPAVCADLADLSTVHEVGTPTPAEQRALWSQALTEAQPAAPLRLAAEFDLDASEIQQIVTAARNGGGPPTVERAWSHGMALSRPQLDALAQRLTPKATWDHIVLGPEPLRLLRCMADQARHRGIVYDQWGWRERTGRGLGISALFTGESGTGKTMAAEVLAGDLELDLYRVDLSGVVSKYIGETEKNLRRLFDAAEHGGVLLFFDEADALFGKRSEVRDSHDRYANIEVNYLLQRMESYRGLAILATNMRSALDAAFTRRLRFVVPFALPGPPERERIWARAFPAGVPTDGLDARRLARLNLSGAIIHSIAMHACFLAAAAGAPVTMAAVLDAARMELRRVERPTNEVASV